MTVKSDERGSQVTMATEEASIPDGGWGWIVVIASFFMVCLMVGGTSCTFGIFYHEFLNYYGESKGKTSWIASIMVATSYCVGPFSSALANRFGCRIIAIIGSITAAAGLLISTQAPNVLTLYFTIGILTGGGFGLMSLPAIVMVSSYFDKKLALATGLAVSGVGLGIFVLAPLTEYLLKILSWQWTMTVIAALVLSSVISGALFRPVVYCPQRESSSNPSLVKQNSNTHIIPSIEFISLEHRTGLNLPSKSNLEAGTTNKEHNFLEKMWNSFREVMDFSLLKDSVFLLFGISNLLTNIGLIVPYIYIKNLVLETGIASPEKASLLLSVIGISNTIGRIVLGYLSDKSCFNRLWIFNICLLICGITVVLICFASSYALIAAYSSIFGVTSGAYSSLTSVIIKDFVGRDKLANAFGIVLVFQGIASLIGPPITGSLYDSTGSYEPGFIISGIALSVSGLILFFVPCISRRSTIHGSQQVDCPMSNVAEESVTSVKHLL
ncbi:monocarboxylate transporter 12 [Caerostris extrusa]|uniref:Monocarboxylate transporter 12 n=1 Tax=Caerostris extrusa TaxID=172846 RepID=A0AAV4Y2C8_CAEEX|nr:monocarboxylate transporter 12 [Caerostris extrusa]